MEVSIFKNFKVVVADKPLQTILEEIKSGIVKKQVTQLRQLVSDGKKEEYSNQKKSLLAFTPSAKFMGGRKLDFLTEYTGYIILDIDQLHPVLLHQAMMIAHQIPYTFACFISPGAEGFKIIVKTNSTLQTHFDTFTALQQFYEKHLNIFIDDSGKDPTRLCFYSFDENIFINPDAHIFNPKKLLLMEQQTEIKEPAVLFEHCKRHTEKKKQFTEGNRNNFIFLLASNCNRKGLKEEQTVYFITEEYDMAIDEIKTTVNSAYNNKAEHNTNQYDEDAPKPPVIDLVEKFLSDRYEFRHNVVTGKLEYKPHNENIFISITDRCENSFLREILKARLKCNPTNLRGILGSDFCKIFNPFHHYFFSLPPWDETTDHITELANTITTTEQEFWKTCFKKWIVAMVGTAIDDKTTNHTVIVFSGKQGLGKTTWLENIVPNELHNHIYSGSINPNNKDTLIHLSECLLINLDELENLNKTEIGALKEVITKTHIRMRKAYGHNNESMQRRASFAGSVNTAQFLNDSTGSRRFLSFEVTAINYQHKVDLNLVYAQALHLFKNGFRFWFNQEEIKTINANNEQYQIKSVEEELLLAHFEIPTDNYRVQYLSATQIISKIANNSKTNVTNSNAVSMGKVLHKLGFKKVKKNGLYVYEIRELTLEEIDANAKQPMEETQNQNSPNPDDLPF